MFGNHYSPKKAFCFMITLAGIFLFTGCGILNQNPLGPPARAKPQAGVKSASNPGLFAITFSPHGLNPTTQATKPSGGSLYTKTASGWFSPESSGELKVKFKYDGDDDDDDGDDILRVEKAKFKVEEGSIDQDVEITMTVQSGTTLEDVGVLFSPAGQEFYPYAKLTLFLEGELDEENLGSIKAYHIEGDSVTELSVKISERDDDEWKIIVEVPGFSRYSLGGNDAEPGTEEWESEEYAETYDGSN